MNGIKKEIENLLEKYNGRVESVVTSLRFNPTLKEQILSSTTFLSDKANLSNRIYHIQHLLTTVPVCKSCGGTVSFWNFREGYRIFCKNVKCSGNDTTVKDKRKETTKKLFGVENVFASKDIQEKIKQRNIAEHGVEYVGQRKDVRKKVEETNLKNYGVKSTTQVPEIKAKQVKTLQENYGVSVPLKSDVLKERSKNTCREKYGKDSTAEVGWIRDKQKETLQKNYGVTTPFASSVIKEKARKTIEEIFGGKHPMQTEDIKSKVKGTCQRKFNSDSPLGNKDIHAKTVKERGKKYFDYLLSSDRLKGLVEPTFSSDEYTTNEFPYEWRCIKCSNVFKDHLDSGRIPRCRECYPVTASKYESEIKEWLQSLSIEVIERNRSIIPPYEIDLYLPDYNFAIEFDGLYWHGELGSNGKCNFNYHLNKTELCEEKGINLIHIFEDEWIDKKDVVKSIIKNRLGLSEERLYARKCKVKEVTSENLYKFLLSNHVHNPTLGKYTYGLYYEGMLVQLISLTKPRFNPKYEYELLRSCSKINTSVVGGFNKLIKYAMKDLNIKSLISYVDRKYFDGSGYKNWNFIGKNRPNYYYVNANKIKKESRLNYQKKNLKIKFPEIYDEKLTEWQIVQLAGYDRIWDCGNFVFELKGE